MLKMKNRKFYEFDHFANDYREIHNKNIKIIEVNTKNISLGPPTYNIMTTPPNPKIIVSPWNSELDSQHNIYSNQEYLISFNIL